MRGGVFMYPRDRKDLSTAGRLRLLYEANPIGFIVEQAGGRASTGHRPILDVVPRERSPADQLRIRRASGGRADRALSPRPQRLRVRCAAVRNPRPVHRRPSDVQRGGRSHVGQTSRHRRDRLLRRRDDFGQQDVRADFPPRAGPRGLRRRRQLSPLQPGRDEGAAWRAPSSAAITSSAISAPTRTCSPSSRSCSAATARPAAAGSASICTMSREAARYRAEARGHSPSGRTCRRKPTCCSTKDCTARS